MLRHCYISEATASIYIASCTSIIVIVYEAISVLEIMIFGCADRSTVVMRNRVCFFMKKLFLTFPATHISFKTIQRLFQHSSMPRLDAPQSYVIVYECLSIFDTLASGCADRNCVQGLFSMKGIVSFCPLLHIDPLRQSSAYPRL